MLEERTSLVRAVHPKRETHEATTLYHTGASRTNPGRDCEIGRWELCLRHLHQRLAPHFARPEVRQHALFALFDWSLVERWQQQRSPRGRPPHPESAYLKAFLLRLREGMMYTSQLRRFLLVHPLLVIELGFHLVLDPSAPYGFDVEASVPSEQWLRLKLRTLDRDLLQDLKLSVRK